MKRLPATVLALGFVSLLTDASSEMIYPLLPAFLVSLGAGGAFIGLVEGVAETTAALFKLAGGELADRLPRRKGLVVFGYGIASLARPLVSIAAAPWHVLAIRFSDRVGKGIRTAPRDALIVEATPDHRRGAAFGLHRGMDHAGALLGPLVAYGLMAGLGLGERAVFALAALPAAASVIVLLVFVRERGLAARTPPPASPGGGGGDPFPRPLKAYLALVGLFTLGNSSDAFLLLRATNLGVPAAMTPLLWALLHVVRSSLSTPLGALSDRLGRRGVIVAGWLVYAAAYVGFALASAPWHAWALFAGYGLYTALVEGAEKALVADLAPATARGRAFGIFHFVVGLAALPASLGFGLVLDRVGPEAAFGLGAGLAFAAALGMAFLPLGRTAPS